MSACRWCNGTGLYHPLTGPSEQCRECSPAQKGIKFHPEALEMVSVALPMNAVPDHLCPMDESYDLSLKAAIVPPIVSPTPYSLIIANLTPAEYEKIHHSGIEYRGATGSNASKKDYGPDAPYIVSTSSEFQRVLKLLGWSEGEYDLGVSYSPFAWYVRRKPTDR